MNTLLVNADALRIPLADGVVQTVVTSPPYWGLRDYGVPGQLGLEPTPDEFVANMVAVFREVWRVLRDDGTAFLNLGDSYAGSWGNYAPTGTGGQRDKSTERFDRRAYGDTSFLPPTAKVPNLKPKDLVGIPWRVAFALQADGWYLRSDIIWSKPNPMPESVTDRPTKSHEYIFLLAKSEKYFYDADAIKEPSVYPNDDRKSRQVSRNKSIPTIQMNGMRPGSATYPTRNKRTVWEITTQPYAGAHFATYPPALVEPCIKAGTSERGCCPKCGKAWERVVDVTRTNYTSYNYQLGANAPMGGGIGKNFPETKREQRGWQPTCTCDAGEPVPCLVFDPFNGSGTTGLVAQKLGRRYIGTDLNRSYLKLAQDRLGHTALDEWTNGIQAETCIDDLPLFGGAS